MGRAAWDEADGIITPTRCACIYIYTHTYMDHILMHIYVCIHMDHILIHIYIYTYVYIYGPNIEFFLRALKRPPTAPSWAPPPKPQAPRPSLPRRAAPPCGVSGRRVEEGLFLLFFLLSSLSGIFLFLIWVSVLVLVLVLGCG